MRAQLTREAFEAEWWKLVKAGKQYVKAYDLLEEWHKSKYGGRRYSSYTGFAQVRDYKKKK